MGLLDVPAVADTEKLTSEEAEMLFPGSLENWENSQSKKDLSHTTWCRWFGKLHSQLGVDVYGRLWYFFSNEEDPHHRDDYVGYAFRWDPELQEWIAMIEVI